MKQQLRTSNELRQFSTNEKKVHNLLGPKTGQDSFSIEFEKLYKEMKVG